jgi:CubicO group peptidase (beta-lactamase class C family)
MTASDTTTVFGFCDTRFDAVRREFERNFAERDDLGAAVAVTLDGAPVVELWGGWLDAARTRPWTRDAIVNVWSVGKAVTAIATLRVAERGLADLDAPVATYWPEFAQAGKERLPLRYLLSHEAGLSAVAKPLPPGANLLSWDTMTAALAEQAPWWEPGTAHGYHVNTYGFLAGEVVRRVTGRRLRDVVHDEIAAPLGIDFFMGFGPEEDARTADWVNPPPDPEAESRRPWLNRDPNEVQGIDLMRILAYRNPPPLPDGRGGTNTRTWRAAEFPSTAPHSNARSIARLFGALACGGAVDGVRVLEADTVDRAIEEQASGEDLVLGRPTRFGLGFQLTMPGIRPLGPNPRAFGHYGNGALLGFADPDARVGFSYVCNRAGRSWRDPRNIALIDALYSAL